MKQCIVKNHIVYIFVSQPSLSSFVSLNLISLLILLLFLT